MIEDTDMRTDKGSEGSTEKKVYSDEEIKEQLEFMTAQRAIAVSKGTLANLAAMLRQLRDERNAVVKELRMLEVEVSVATGWRGKRECVDLTRSEKYEKGDAG